MSQLNLVYLNWLKNKVKRLNLYTVIASFTMQKELLLSLKLDSREAEEKLKQLQSQKVDLIDTAKVNESLTGISNKLAELKQSVTVSLNVDEKQVEEELNKTKAKITSNLEKDAVVKIKAELDSDTALLREELQKALDTSGSLGNLNIIEGTIGKIVSTLSQSLTGTVEIDTSSVDEALEKIDALQVKLTKLGANVGIDLNIPEINKEKETVVAVAPKSSEDVRKVEQDVNSTVKTSLSANYVENVQKDTAKANNQATRGKLDTVEGYLKNLLTHQKTIMESGTGFDLDPKILTKLGTVIAKVEKSVAKKGGDSDAIRKQVAGDYKLPDGAFVLSELDDFNNDLGRASQVVQATGVVQTGAAKKLQEFGSAISHAMAALSKLPETNPEIRRDANFNIKANGQASGQHISLSPAVTSALLGKDKGMASSQLETVIHEIRHTQQKKKYEQSGLRKRDIITEASNDEEAKIVQRVEKNYADKAPDTIAIEKDAALFAHRTVRDIAKALDITLIDKSPFEMLSTKADNYMAKVKETFDKLHGSTDLTDEQVAEYSALIREGSAKMSQMRELMFRKSDKFEQQGDTEKALQYKGAGLRIPDLQASGYGRDMTLEGLNTQRYENNPIGEQAVEKAHGQAASNNLNRAAESLENAAEDLNNADIAEAVSELADDDDDVRPELRQRPDYITEVRARQENDEFAAQEAEYLDQAEAEKAANDEYKETHGLEGLIGSLEDADGLVGQLGSSLKGMWQFLTNTTAPAMFVKISTALVGMVASSVETVVAFQKLEQTLNSLQVGDSVAALQTVRRLSVQVGVDMEEAAGAISGFSAATMDTSMENEASRIFEAVARYGASIGATQDEMSRGFKALEQMAAKG